MDGQGDAQVEVSENQKDFYKSFRLLYQVLRYALLRQRNHDELAQR